MKKIFSLITIILLGLITSACDCAFITNSTTNTNSITNTNTNTEITEVEWEAINDITNYTMNFVAKSANRNGSPIILNRTIKSTNTTMYYKRTQNGSLSEESYYIIEDDQQYYLTKWNEQLQKYDEIWHAYQNVWNPKSMNDALDFGIDIGYENLVYDKDTKAYTYTMAEEGLVGIIAYYFEDGNLIKVTANTYVASNIEDVSQENVIESIDVTFSFIGTTNIEVPEYTLESEK